MTPLSRQEFAEWGETSGLRFTGLAGPDLEDALFRGASSQHINAVIRCDSRQPAGERKRRVISGELPLRFQKNLVRRVLCGIERIQKIPAQAEDPSVMRLVDVREVSHRRMHAVLKSYYELDRTKLQWKIRLT